jgi:hypothetical protein
MDPSVVNSLSAGFALSALRESNEQTNRIGRQSDGAAADMRGIGAAVFRELCQSGDPATVMDYNTASHVPTAQPYVAPNFIQPTGAMATGS